MCIFACQIVSTFSRFFRKGVIFNYLLSSLNCDLLRTYYNIISYYAHDIKTILKLLTTYAKIRKLEYQNILL